MELLAIRKEIIAYAAYQSSSELVAKTAIVDAEESDCTCDAKRTWWLLTSGNACSGLSDLYGVVEYLHYS